MKSGKRFGGTAVGCSQMKCRVTGIPSLLLTIVIATVAFSQQSFAGDVTLAWQAGTQPRLAGYRLYIGDASGQYGSAIDVGSVTTYTVTGLAPGAHFFVVQAYGTLGEVSPYSNEVAATVAGDDIRPPVISAVGSTIISCSSAAVEWTTDEPSDSQIAYGTTPSYGSSAKTTLRSLSIQASCLPRSS